MSDITNTLRFYRYSPYPTRFCRSLAMSDKPDSTVLKIEHNNIQESIINQKTQFVNTGRGQISRYFVRYREKTSKKTTRHIIEQIINIYYTSLKTIVIWQMQSIHILKYACKEGLHRSNIHSFCICYSLALTHLVLLTSGLYVQHDFLIKINFRLLRK